MVALISAKAWKDLAIHLKMDVSVFQSLSDEKCVKKLDQHFKMEDTPNYHSFLLKRYNKFLFLRVIGYHSVHMYCMQIIIMALIRFILLQR